MRNFQGQKFISRVNFQAAKHHKQVLRQQIKPELFQKLQISQNPSANYMNAYKSMFKDELQKTMEQHMQKKAKDEYQQYDDKVSYSLNPMTNSRFKEQMMMGSMVGQDPEQLKYYEHPVNNNVNMMQNPGMSYHMQGVNQQSPSQFTQMQNMNNATKFRDFFEQRTNKFENHIKNNFDGGQQFFKVQDAYHMKKLKQTQNYAQFLKKQVQQKNNNKFTQRQKQNQQHLALKQMQQYQKQLDRQKYMKQMQKKMYEKEDKMHQVQEQRMRRQRRSKQFQYNNYALHNPITNPIQYHIDNPYILKKIQDKTGL